MTVALIQLPPDKTLQAVEAPVESESLTVKALAGNSGNVRVGTRAEIEADTGTVLAAEETAVLDPTAEPSYRCEYSEDGIAWVAT